jgi:hypothetical protein
MCTIVTKERNQLNIEDYSCRECNIFVDSGGLGIGFYFFSNSKLLQHQQHYTQHLHFIHSSRQTFLHLQIG